MYPSSSIGDSNCTSAILSKLALLVSSGRYRPASISSASSSRIDPSYSAWFRRWKVRLPGIGWSAAAASSSASSASTNANSVSPAGRLAPGGGIIAARSLRTMRSATSALSAAASVSKPCKERFPVTRRSLWQRTQYVSMTSLCEAGSSADGARVEGPTTALVQWSCHAATPVSGSPTKTSRMPSADIAVSVFIRSPLSRPDHYQCRTPGPGLLLTCVARPAQGGRHDT